MKLQPPQFRHSERGVSLMEMLVVVAIVGVLSLVTVPNFMSMYQGQRMKASTRTMITDVRNARQLAISGNQRTKISFKTGVNVHDYEVYREVKDRMTNTAEWKRVRFGNLGITAYIDSSSFDDFITGDGGTKDVVFRPNGTIENIPASGTPYIDIKTKQKVAKPSYRLTFTVSGNVKLT